MRAGVPKKRIMSMIAGLAAAVGLLAVPRLAPAQTAPATDDPCARASTAADLNRCAESRFHAAEKLLAEAHNAAVERIAKGELSDASQRDRWKAAFDAAHKAWMLYRDADCRATIPFEWEGNPSAQGAVMECLAEKTELRAVDIKERYGDK